MNLIKAFATIFLLVFVAVLFQVARVSACDPDDPDADPLGINCRTVKPVPSVEPTRAGKNGLTTSNGSTNLANIADPSLPLECLLPEGESSMNALGVASQCTWTPVQLRAVKVLPTPPTVKANVPTPARVQPKGDSPFSAMTMTDQWQTIEAGARQWYKIDNGNNFYLDVWLDAYGRGNLTLAMYAPEQTNHLSPDLPPKGRGGPVKNEPTHDLYWSGAYATGTWYALVTNYNTVPVQYRIGTKQSSTDRNCVSYWEFLPTGQYVLWTDCGHYTDTSKK